MKVTYELYQLYQKMACTVLYLTQLYDKIEELEIQMIVEDGGKMDYLNTVLKQKQRELKETTEKYNNLLMELRNHQQPLINCVVNTTPQQ